MDVHVLPDADAVAVAAADAIEAALDAPWPVIGLAAGNTPRATYAELARRHEHRELRFDHAQYVLLDEYVDVPTDHPASFRNDLLTSFAARVGVPAESVHAPMGGGGRPETAAAQYESLLAELGPRTIQLLGIGRNGHIGFNEPGTGFDTRTHVAVLHGDTRLDNAAAFTDRDVPTHAITMGIASILDAHRILLLATGTAKASAIAAAVSGPVDPSVPASALRLHPDVVLLLDPHAASRLAD